MSETDYFNLYIKKESEDFFGVHLLDDDGYEITKINFSIDDIDLQYISKLKESVGEDIQDTICKFGFKLFNILFKDEILDQYNSKINSGHFIRIKLIFNSNDSFLLSIPWEFIYDGINFLSAFSNVSLSRTIKDSNTGEEIIIKGQINMLVVVSNPDDLLENDRLKIELEERNISYAVSRFSSNIKIDFEEKASLRNIQNCLDNNQYHILHYIGHGTFSEDSDRGYLLLEDDHGNSKVVNNTTIADLFRISNFKTCCSLRMSNCKIR